MIASGDVLISLEDLDETVRAGSIVSVDEVCCDGEYLVLDGAPARSYRADAFVVAVRRPWWAWGHEAAWKAEALAAARARLADLDRDQGGFRELISETLSSRSAAEVEAHVA